MSHLTSRQSRLEVGIELAQPTMNEAADGRRHSNLSKSTQRGTKKEARRRIRRDLLRLASTRFRKRRQIMSTVYWLPGESSTHILSSIINLICPQCGGRVSDFECEGRCGRNWLAEWEWANRTRESVPRTRVRSRQPKS